MAVTVSPSAEACIALVDQINSGTAYALNVLATYSRVEVDPLEEIDGLRVDVMAVEETQLAETLSIEDRTSHRITIFIRDKFDNTDPETIDERSLIVRQILQRVNNFTSPDRRVNVWEVDGENDMKPDKELLRTASLFVAKVVLSRVEVEAS